MEDVTDLLCKQLEFCGQVDIMLCSEPAIALPRSAFSGMPIENIQPYYEEIKKGLIGFGGSDNVWIRNVERNAKSSVGFIPLFSEDQNRRSRVWRG